jgi:hypothetical protein
MYKLILSQSASKSSKLWAVYSEPATERQLQVQQLALGSSTILTLLRQLVRRECDVMENVCRDEIKAMDVLGNVMKA